jgi:hypothetical protein
MSVSLNKCTGNCADPEARLCRYHCKLVDAVMANYRRNVNLNGMGRVELNSQYNYSSHPLISFN